MCAGSFPGLCLQLVRQRRERDTACHVPKFLQSVAQLILALALASPWDVILCDYAIHWNGKDADGKPVASGTYLYKLTAGEFAQTKRMLLVR